MFDTTIDRLNRWLDRHPKLRGRWANHGWVNATRQGINWRLCLDHYLDRQLYLTGALEPETTKRVRQFVKPGMRVLDVGANFGYFTVMMAKLIGPNGHIWAFEPTTTYRNRLKNHLATNRVDGRVNVLPYGLSDQSTRAEIQIDECSATLHSVDSQTVTRCEPIELRKLDEVADQLKLKNIDFIKVDIDGHEAQMLSGGERLIRQCRPAMVIEFSQANLDVAGSDVRSLQERIEDLGYQLYSDKTGRPYENQRDFLLECGNFTFSANVWALPRGARPSLRLAA